MFREFSILMIAGAVAACEPEVKVGAWPCTSSTGPVADASDGSVSVPWQNGFEDGFCGYARAKGFCYTDPYASYALVEAPVHSGLRAARFTVTAAEDQGKQTRCVREGKLPGDAVYGAWFFLSSKATVQENWNLMFFNGYIPSSMPDNNLKGQWDVSLGDGDGGPLTLHLLNQLTGDVIPDPILPDGGMREPSPPVPVGEWFHVEFRYLRSQNATGGAVALYQDGELIGKSENIQTERTDVTWGQWYVGNLVGKVTPADSTLYVDDVSIAPPP